MFSGSRLLLLLVVDTKTIKKLAHIFSIEISECMQVLCRSESAGFVEDMTKRFVCFLRFTVLYTVLRKKETNSFWYLT